MTKPHAFVPDEILHHLFDNIPVLINLAGPDGFVRHVNRCWEETLGWSQPEIAEHQPDIFGECYPKPGEKQRALDFLFSGQGEWAEFKPRTRTGRAILTFWTVLTLPSGMVLGVGVRERERRFVERQLGEPVAYVRKLFAPSPGADPNLKLLRVTAHGDALALCLRAGKRRVTAIVPVELVNLSARYGSADLILHIVQNEVFNASASPGPTQEKRTGPGEPPA